MVHFRYTTDLDRKLFAEKVHRIGIIKLMRMIHNINWSSYSFNSDCTLLHCRNEDEYSDSLDTYDFIVKPVRAHCSTVPYHFFGGSVYFLYTTNEPDLHHFMDPTADVDVSIDIPIIDSIGDNEPLDEYHKSILKRGDGQNELTEPNEMIGDYLNWLLNEVYTLFEREFTNIYDDLEEYIYITPAILTRNIHNKVHISIIQEYNMIKIQIECKVIGMQKPDHLLELVVSSKITEQTMNTWDYGSEFVRNFKKNTIVEKNGLFIQSYDELISDNIDSITNRIDTLQKHKLYNHIARLQYLNYIYPNHKVPISDDIKKLLYFLWQNRANMQIYNYNREYNSIEFMLSMIGNFLKRLRADKVLKGSIIVQVSVTQIKNGIEVNVKKYKNVTTKELLTMYEPFIARVRGRSLTRKTHKITRRKSETKTKTKTIHKTRKRGMSY